MKNKLKNKKIFPFFEFLNVVINNPNSFSAKYWRRLIRKFNFVVRPRISSDNVFFLLKVRKIIFLPCRFTSSFIFVKIYSHARVCLCTFIILLFAFFFFFFLILNFHDGVGNIFGNQKNSRHLFFFFLLFFIFPVNCFEAFVVCRVGRNPENVLTCHCQMTSRLPFYHRPLLSSSSSFHV